MSLLDKISNNFRKKLQKTLEDKNNIFEYIYYSDVELFQFDFKDDNLKDFIYMLTKLIPFVYYEHSKHKLDESGFDTTVFMCWPDLRRIRSPMRLTDLFRRVGNPIFTGIRIPFDQSDNFISVYQNALLELVRNDDREPTPDNYKIYPISTFKNTHPAEYFNFTSFVEYCGEYWGELYNYKKIRRHPFFDERNFGYNRLPGARFDLQRAIVNRAEDEESENEDESLPPTPPINGKESFYSPECVICMSEKPNILFCNCGHIHICVNCDDLNENSNKCPVCKTDSNIKRKI